MFPRQQPQEHALSWNVDGLHCLSGRRIKPILPSLSSPGRLLVSAAGKRKSTSNVWKTVWRCWKTKTRPWLKSWKHWRTFTATKLSSGGGLRAEQRTGYKLLQQNKKKERDSGTKTALTVFVSLLTQAWFCAEFRSVPVNYEQLELASFALVLVVFACEDSSVLHTLCLLLLLCTGKASQWEPAAEEEQEEEMQVLPENVPLKSSPKKTKKKPRLVSQVSIPASFSEVRHGAHRATQVQQDLHQGNSTMFTWLSLLGHVSCGFCVVSCIPSCETQLSFFKHFVTQVISWIDLVEKLFQENTNELKSSWKSSFGWHGLGCLNQSLVEKVLFYFIFNEERWIKCESRSTTAFSNTPNVSACISEDL